MLDSLAKRLKQLRVQSQYTQAYVADRLNISREAYSFYENGRRQPSVEMLLILADFYGVSVDYILGRTGNSFPFHKIPEEFNQLMMMYSALSLQDQKLVLRIIKHQYELLKKRRR